MFFIFYVILVWKWLSEEAETIVTQHPYYRDYGLAILVCETPLVIGIVSCLLMKSHNPDLVPCDETVSVVKCA